MDSKFFAVATSIVLYNNIKDFTGAKVIGAIDNENIIYPISAEEYKSLQKNKEIKCYTYDEIQLLKKKEKQTFVLKSKKNIDEKNLSH